MFLTYSRKQECLVASLQTLQRKPFPKTKEKVTTFLLTKEDTKDWLVNSFTTHIQDQVLASLASQCMNSPTKEHMGRLLHILRYLKKTPGEGLNFKKIGKRILRSLLMPIGLAAPLIEDPHPGTVLMCGETSLLGEVKNKQLLLEVVWKQSSELWPAEYVKECG